MGRRAALEGTRTASSPPPAPRWASAPHVTIESLADLLAPAQASAALARSAELRGLLAEVVREHAINRVLMRQELAFLDHLMRQLGAEPDTGYGALAGGAAGPRLRPRPAGLLPNPRSAGLTMISSFLGLQTSLRGLLAQQQALDVAAHNVANANTVGYTRQEATLGAADTLHLAAGALQNGAGAFLGQGVDVTAYRRLRDSFLDLQVRAQSMALGDATTSAEALDRVQSAVGEPSTTGINALMGKFYTAWSDLANHPESDSSKQAVASAAQTLADAFGKLAGDITSAGNDANAEFTSITGATGPIKAAATSLAQLNKAIRHRHRRRPEPERPARPPRPDPRRPQPVRAGLGQPARQRPHPGHARQPVRRQRHDRRLADAPARGLRPRRRPARRAQDARHHHLPGYLASLDAVAKTLARRRQRRLRLRPSSRRHRRHARRPASPPHRRSPPGRAAATASNDIATAVAALRDTSAATSQYGGLVRQIGARRRRRDERPVDRPGRRRRRPGPPPERLRRLARRGDGQHARASSAATRPRPARCRPIDDMLDTLINRAGRVGL